MFTRRRSRNAMRKPAKSQALEIIKRRNVPVGTVIDVGVQHCTPELVGAFPDRKHILFEPVAEYRDSIEENYRGLDYELHAVAVCDHPGAVTLDVRSIILGMAISHSGIVDGWAKPSGDAARREVEAVSLDSFLVGRSILTPYLLKIDIDGGELAVLAGAKETLRQTSVLIIETPKDQLAERIAAAEGHGFELFDLAEPVYYDQAFWQCDAVFIRTDIHHQCFRRLALDFDPSLYVPFR